MKTDTPALTNPLEAAALKTVSPLRKIAQDVVRAMVATLVNVLEKVLENKELPSNRAYILSDLMGAMAGDRMCSLQMSKRIEATKLRPICGALAGKLRGEFATNLAAQFAAGNDELPTEEEEQIDEETAALLQE